MDKQQVTEALKNLLDNNKMDISAMAKNSPEVYDAFNKVVNAISSKYGSGENFDAIPPQIYNPSYKQFLIYINDATRVAPLERNTWALDYYQYLLTTKPPQNYPISNFEIDIFDANNDTSSLLNSKRFNTFGLFRWMYGQFKYVFTKYVWDLLLNPMTMNSWSEDDFVYQFALKLLFESTDKNRVGIYSANLFISLGKEEIKNILNGTYNIDFGELYKKQMYENIYGTLDTSTKAKLIANFSVNNINGSSYGVNGFIDDDDKNFFLGDFGINQLYFGEKVKLKYINFFSNNVSLVIGGYNDSWYDMDSLFRRLKDHYAEIMVVVHWEKFKMYKINKLGGIKEEVYDDDSYIQFKVRINPSFDDFRWNIGNIIYETLSFKVTHKHMEDFWVEQPSKYDFTKEPFTYVSEVKTNITLDDYYAKNFDYGECIFSNAEKEFPLLFQNLKNATQPKPQLATKTVKLSQLNDYVNELGKSGWTVDWKKNKKKAQPNWTPKNEMDYGVGNDTSIYYAQEKNGKLVWRTVDNDFDIFLQENLEQLPKEDLYLLLDQKNSRKEYYEKNEGGFIDQETVDNEVSELKGNLKLIYNQILNT